MIKVKLADGRVVNVQTDDPDKAAQVARRWTEQNPQATRRYEVTSPDGRKFIVQAPEGATQAQVLARAQGHAKVNPARKSDWKDTVGGAAGNFLEGALPGSSGFLRGVREMAINAAQAPFSDKVDFEPGKAYSKGQAFQNERNKTFQREHPGGTWATQGAGMAAGLVLPAAKIARAPNMAQRLRAATKTGGAYGALSGAMSSSKDSLQGKAEDAISSGLVGATVGAAVPVAGRVASASAAPFRPLTQPVTRTLGKGMEGLGDILPGSLGTRIAREGQQLARDPAQAAANRELDQVIRAGAHPVTGEPLRPMQVAGEVERRQGLGVPAVAADLDDGMRDRFRSAARSPGRAQLMVRRYIDERKEQEAARAAEHISATLGPIGDVQGQAQALTQEAKRNAGPLFDLSDAHEVPLANELQELFSRPTGRKAIDAASLSLQNRGLSPVQDGLIQQADGSWSKGSVPTMQAYDHAKTHLDDMVFADRSPFATPEVRRDAEGASSIRARLLELMDGDGSGPRSGPPDFPRGPIEPSYAERMGLPKPPPGGINAPGPWTGQRLHPEAEEAAGWSLPPQGLNPYWKPARDAYAGPVQNRKALELGEEMTKADAGDIAHRTGNMTPSQQEFFRLGHRSGLAGDLASLPDYADNARRLAGSSGKREAITAAHGPEATQALTNRLDLEQDATHTWEAVRGSPGGAAPDLAQQDQQIEDAARGAVQTLTGRPGAGFANIVSALARGDRGAQEVNGHIATVLAEKDPEALKAAMRELQKERARKALVDRNAARAQQQTGRFLGGVLGSNVIAPADDEAAY